MEKPGAENTSTTNAGKNVTKLRSIAKYQKFVMFALLANFGCNVLSVLTRNATLPVQIGVLGLCICVVIFSLVSVFMLASNVYSSATGVLCALAMIIPCISLIVLLVVNQRATGILKENGLSVGLLGADMDQLKDL